MKVKNELKEENLEIIIDENTEFRIVGDDGEPLDPENFTVYIENGWLYVVPNIIDLSETEYYDFKEKYIKRKH